MARSTSASARRTSVRTNAGGIAVSIVALFLGLLAVTQVRAQDVYTRSLELETPSSLTTLIGVRRPQYSNTYWISAAWAARVIAGRKRFPMYEK